MSVRGKKLAAEDAERALDALLGLPMRSMSSRELSPSALRLALSRGVSVYDACYLALAEAVGAVLVTADRRLAEVATKSELLPSR